MVSTPVIHVITVHGLLLIYQPWRDGRLSWPGWLTHSRHFIHKMVTYQPYIRHRSGKVRQPKNNVLTTEPRRSLGVVEVTAATVGQWSILLHAYFAHKKHHACGTTHGHNLYDLPSPELCWRVRCAGASAARPPHWRATNVRHRHHPVA